MGGFASRCHNDIFTWILLLSCAHSVSHCLPSLFTHKNSSLMVRSAALSLSHAAHNSKFRPPENSSVLGLFCAPLSHANLEASARWVCAKSLLLFLILISSAFRNLREIKVVCGRMYELAGASDDDRQGFYRFAGQKSAGLRNC